LYLTVAGLKVEEDFADVADRSLYLADMLRLLPLHYQCNADDLGGAMTNRRRISPGSDEARTEGLEMSVWRSSSARCVLSIQWKELNFFNNLYRGSPRSPS
jgi:hypothetical protein